MRCRNADEFERDLTNIFSAGDNVRAVLEQNLQHVEDKTEEKARQKSVQFWLECHARDFLINHILSALNWQLQPSVDAGEYIEANLVTEQNPDGSGSRKLKEETPEHSRRLDYLGYARDSDQPLLVVEAKRPNLGLPGGTYPLAPPSSHPVAKLLVKALKAICQGTSIPERTLNRKWIEPVEQLRNYCGTIAATRDDWPARAVLTNGMWLILFVDPKNAFADSLNPSIEEHDILVFESCERLIEHHKLIWQCLEYSSLAKPDRRLAISQVPFVVDPEKIESCCFGMRITYTFKTTNFNKVPLLNVSPLLFLRSTDATFVQVASSWEAEIPVDNNGSISDHIQEVGTKGQDLKHEFEERILGGRILPLVSVLDHCEHPEAKRIRPLIQSCRIREEGERFLMLTGSIPHFALDSNDYAECEFHHCVNARVRGTAQQSGPVLESSIDPKSYFVDQSIHHCTHKEVYEVKREQITEGNKERCGHRRSDISSAFCLIWKFEEFFCCRGCVFHPICELAQAYSLPCNALVSLPSSAVLSDQSDRE